MKRTLTILGLVAGLATAFTLIRAGTLEPPGPPSPTMKSLDVVEPRTPIRAADLPLTISSPGSYYLAEDIDTTGGGITISSSDVTLDLMGFTLAGGTGDGISADSGVQGVTVRNGVVSDWAGNGVTLWGFSLVSGVLAHDNGANGIQIINTAVVGDCVARDNAANGFDLGPGSTLVGCTATSNDEHGILTAAGCTVNRCTSVSNVLDGINAHGVVRDCVARLNTGNGIVANHGSQVIGCMSAENDAHGISSDSGTRIEANTSRSNGLDGIRVTNDVVVIDNSCTDNGRLSDGAGIHVLNTTGARVEGNSVSGNDRGIYVFRSGNVIVKNMATGNATNYDIASGNVLGPIVSDPNGAGPWDNIEW
jgi:parallel beta-helix repeat protein